MKRAVLTLAFVLLLAPVALAHEGHTIKVMGTVRSVDGQQVTITTTAGKTAVVLLDVKTKVLSGKVAKKPADIKVGYRVVVTASDVKGKDGKTTLVAKQVILSASAVAVASGKK